MERKQPSEEYSLPEYDRKGPVRTRHESDRETERGALTLWRRQREGLVRTPKESDRARDTHRLETAKGGSCQATERKRTVKWHLLPGERRRMDKSGHVKNEMCDSSDSVTIEISAWNMDLKGQTDRILESPRLSVRGNS
jgi:hypothetical protein